MLWMFLALIALAHASIASAEASYVAPDHVSAEANGSFSFRVLLVADEHSLGWAGYAYMGKENVEAEIRVDGSCEILHEFVPGQPVIFEVIGRLIDPTSRGLVWSTSTFCEGGGGEQHTTVLPSGVPNVEASWSTLKARFR